MRSGRLILLALLFTAVLIPVSAAGQRRGDRDLKEQKPVPTPADNPRAVFRRFETAWKSSDADAVSSILGDKRIHVDIKGMGDKGGYYSRSQVFYLLKRMFREQRQLKFEFVKYHNIDRPGRRVYAIAYRSYKNLRSDRVFQDKVYITLERDGEGWDVVGIRTTK